MIPVPSFECTLEGARVDCMEVSRVTLNVPNLAILSHRETSFLELVGKWYILNCILNFLSFSGPLSSSSFFRGREKFTIPTDLSP